MRDRVYCLTLGDALAKVSQRWTEQEFAGLDLGDARLNKRARTMMGTVNLRVRGKFCKVAG
ncbi:IS4/Tn5 family transposase DNA-binding protein [Massilia aquatica]|uniref:IS4/Tn5 family transposase DNA-binding protein n=1 Tax=Massilia aquatica TaxID=2609000 RepID=UPI00351D62E0